MKDFSNVVHSASSTLLHSSYAIVRTGAYMRCCLDEVFAEANDFFERPASEKGRFQRPDILEGYRTFGAEFSETTARPDLNESFSLVLRNSRREDLAAWRVTNSMYRAMRAVGPIYAAVADGILEGLARSFDPDADRIESADFSYFQLNYYRPRQEAREFLQDAHEDGHLLTIVTSRQPGLEIEIDGQFEPVILEPDELLIMPGSILTLMTGGTIRPLIHRVRNVAAVPTRASLMFFVNASVTSPPRAWAPAEDGSFPDIGRATIESSKVFGLTSIQALAR